ncbi:MAG: thiosulfate dehydrogenase (quinone) large subunit [Thermomicrobiales bacterium]|jgi:thiosulfate dehydrogenase [quinone] large subunit|nr:thiosulfate dehydrogenase (quinone) large subunit [Thermomicrobiales bacterium]
MTRNRTYALTAVAAALYLALCAIFADGLFGGTWWDAQAIASSTVFTYLLLALIVGAGLLQARRLPAAGIPLGPAREPATPGQIDDPPAWKRLMGNTWFAIAWLPVRFFVGRAWLDAGEHKLRDDAWMQGGSALKGFWTSAVAVPEGPARPRIVAEYGWFRDTLQYMLDHEWYTWFAKAIAVGEVLIGIGLLVGALVGIAAFFGTLMNFNFQLAGTASTNPVLFGLGVFLVLAWKVAGWWGLDRWLLTRLGTPWARGQATTGHPVAPVRPPQVAAA